MAIGNIAYGNDANCEALRPFIPALVSVLERHGSSPEVTDAGLATVVCVLCIIYMHYVYVKYILYIFIFSQIQLCLKVKLKIIDVLCVYNINY